MRLSPAILTLLLLCLPAHADDTQYPLGAFIGLTPPPGMVRSKIFSGFEDPRSEAKIILTDIPPGASAQVEAAMSEAGAKAQGITVLKREVFPTATGMALLSSGRQDSDGADKWLMLATGGSIAEGTGRTGLVIVQIPPAAQTRYPGSVIRAALATVTFRDGVAVDEQLSILPFTLRDLANFDVVRVLPPATVLLTDGPQESAQDLTRPHLFITVVPAGPEGTDERASFARATLNSVGGFKDVRITFSEPVRLPNNQNVWELRADAKENRTGADMTIVQWLRFGNTASIQIVGVTPKDDFFRDFPRFRKVRDGIGGKKSVPQ